MKLSDISAGLSGYFKKAADFIKALKGPKLYGLSGGLALFLLVLFCFSGFSSGQLNSIQVELEKGNLPSSWSLNPFRSLKAGATLSYQAAFQAAMDRVPPDMAGLQKAFSNEVKYLAYHPKDAEAVADLAEYYYLNGMELPAESLALKAVQLDPFNRRVRTQACQVNAYSMDDRERMLASTWDMLRAERNFLKNSEKIGPQTHWVYRILWNLWDLRQKMNYHFPAVDFNGDPQVQKQRLAVLEAEENSLAPRYAFSLFLTDPARWAQDARDVLDDEAVKDPANLEFRFAVAEWQDNSATAQAAYQDFINRSPRDCAARKRMDQLRDGFAHSPNEDQKIACLDLYAPRHPAGEAWTKLEKTGLNQFQKGYVISSPDPEGEGDNDLDELNKIAGGTQALLPNEKPSDFVYPQPAENQLSIDELFKSAKALPACPLILPLTDGAGKPTRMGAYLSTLAMIRASYLPDSVLTLRNVMSEFSWERSPLAPKTLNPVLNEQAEMGTRSSCAGSLLDDHGGYTASVTFSGEFPQASYAKKFKKGQLHLVPNWIAQKTNQWMRTKLRKDQKKCLSRPFYGDDADLFQAFYVEAFGSWSYETTPPSDDIFAKNPSSSLAVTIYYNHQDTMRGGYDTAPLEAYLKKYPKDDMVKKLLASNYANEKMYGKSNQIYFDLLSRNPTDTSIYGNTVYNFKRLGDWAAARHFYEKAAEAFPQNGLVQAAAGNFFKDYAWAARGTGWSYQVTPWNGELLDRRLGLARTYYEKSEQENPYDVSAFASHMYLEMVEDDDMTKSDALFNQAVTLSTENYDLFSDRLESLKGIWRGSDEKMMAFAQQWEAQHPRLMIEALAEKTRNIIGQDNDDQGLYNATIGAPEMWAPLNKAYQELVDTYADTFEVWTEYADEAAKTNHLPDFLAYARAKASQDLIVRSFLPYIVILSYDYRAQTIGWEHDGQVFLNSQDVWNDYYDALMAAANQDPHNYGFLNEMALRCVGWNRYELAQVLFNRIGDHWAPSAGTRQKFDQYKAVAFGKAHPTWHVCTKPVNAKDEHY